MASRRDVVDSVSARRRSALATRERIVEARADPVPVIRPWRADVTRRAPDFFAIICRNGINCAKVGSRQSRKS